MSRTIYYFSKLKVRRHCDEPDGSASRNEGANHSLSKIIFKLSIISWVMLSPLSSFAENNQKSARWYKVHWNNMYLADLKVELRDNDITAKIDSHGVIKTISKYSNYSHSKFHNNNGKYIPEIFNSNLTQRQGKKDIIIKYGENGEITEESVIPPDNRYKRPAVENHLKKDAPNPLVAVLLTRDKIRESLEKGENKFEYNIYDGRRLARLEFNIIGKETIKLHGNNLNALKITFKRIPVAGFTNNELKRMKGENPDFTIYLDEKDLLPIKADAVAPLGKAFFTLVKECESIEKCK